MFKICTKCQHEIKEKPESLEFQNKTLFYHQECLMQYLFTGVADALIRDNDRLDRKFKREHS